MFSTFSNIKFNGEREVIMFANRDEPTPAYLHFEKGAVLTFQQYDDCEDEPTVIHNRATYKGEHKGVKAFLDTTVNWIETGDNKKRIAIALKLSKVVGDISKSLYPRTPELQQTLTDFTITLIFEIEDAVEGYCEQVIDNLKCFTDKELAVPLSDIDFTKYDSCIDFIYQDKGGVWTSDYSHGSVNKSLSYLPVTDIASDVIFIVQSVETGNPKLIRASL